MSKKRKTVFNALKKLARKDELKELRAVAEKAEVESGLKFRVKKNKDNDRRRIPFLLLVEEDCDFYGDRDMVLEEIERIVSGEDADDVLAAMAELIGNAHDVGLHLQVPEPGAPFYELHMLDQGLTLLTYEEAEQAVRVTDFVLDALQKVSKADRTHGSECTCDACDFARTCA